MFLPLSILSLVACGDADDIIGPSDPDPNSILPADQYDVDEDGYAATDDCDDGNAQVYPGAPEVCDEVDNDCDDEVDEPDAEDAETWYIDNDGDGFGSSEETIVACDLPTGYAANDQDCDDDDAATNPLGSEICDGLDNDCDEGDKDGGIDEGDDNDADGFDDVCGGDCNDSNSEVNPGAIEVCDNIDNDCDESIDGPDAEDAETYWLDSDGDGYGDPLSPESACEASLGYVQNELDCDDADEEISPLATEICGDFIDNDCDGSANDCDLEGTVSLSEAPGLILGSTEDANAGYAVTGGYINDDEFSDLLVSAMTESNAGGTQAGAVYLFLGPLTGSIGTDGADAALLGPEANAQSGRDVDICDLDGDGQGDVVSGAWNHTDLTGAAVIYLNPLGDQDADAVVLGSEIDDRAGWSVDCLGDVDGDGNDDIAVGAVTNDGEDTDAGAAYVLLGPVTGYATMSDAWATWTGETAGDYAGASVSGPGDLDGDGSMDLLVGASLEATGGSNAGASYIVHGPLTGGTANLSTADAKITGANVNDKAFNLSSPGDVNRDGWPDLLIGAATFDGNGTERGRAHLLHGPVTADFDLSDTASISALWRGESNMDHAATSLAGAGDMNADGAADIIIGAYGDDTLGSESGSAYIIYGPTSDNNSLADAPVKLTGVTAGDYAGWAVDTVGDVNGDGYDDVIIGAKYESTAYTNAGAAYVVLGSGL